MVKFQFSHLQGGTETIKSYPLIINQVHKE